MGYPARPTKTAGGEAPDRSVEDILFMTGTMEALRSRIAHLRPQKPRPLQVMHRCMVYKCRRGLINMMKKISDKLLAYLKNVPKGKVTTYQQLAERFGTHPRAVGSILKSNPTPIVVPCHRVVCSDGGIGGYKLGVQKKIALLKKEGVKIKERKIALEIYKWKAAEKGKK